MYSAIQRAARPLILIGILLLAAGCEPAADDGALPTLAQLPTSAPATPTPAPADASATPVPTEAAGPIPPSPTAEGAPADPFTGPEATAEATPDEDPFAPPMDPQQTLPDSYAAGDQLLVVGTITVDEDGARLTDADGASIALIIDDFLLEAVGDQLVEIIGPVVAEGDTLRLRVESARTLGEGGSATVDGGFLEPDAPLEGVLIEPGLTALATYDALREALADDLEADARWLLLSGNPRIGWTYTFATDEAAFSYYVASTGEVYFSDDVIAPADDAPTLDRDGIAIDSDAVGEALIEAGSSPLDVTLFLLADADGLVWQAVDFAQETTLAIDAVTGTIRAGS